MNEPQPRLNHRSSDNRCPDCVTDAAQQFAALRKEMHDQSEILVRIDVALVGDYEHQGLIGRLDKQICDLKNDVHSLKIWREETKKATRDLAGRIVAYGLVAIGILITAAYVIIKG